ncbi:MAG: acyltransferase [Thermoleophilia bacterium]|nr:acyltransferase [Thermoleophilia bacterium]
MANLPRHDTTEPIPGAAPVTVAAAPPMRSPRRRQPRNVDGSYVSIERRELPALTSLRWFAAFYVVIHHLINVALLHTDGDDADRSATWYLAWGTQGHVGVTFFFVLSGFILAWCYHRTFALGGEPDSPEARPARRRFWIARFARVWPLHAVMFLAFVPLALLDAGRTPIELLRTAGTGVLNLSLLHAWVPFGGPDGLSDTFNAPSWTLSDEALFYVMFPFLAALLVRRLRWGAAQLGALALGSWALLGALGVALAGSERGEWAMRVFPPVRALDFVIGVALGLIVVQGLQLASLHARPVQRPTTHAWTMLEALTLLAAACSPLVWAVALEDVLPDTLGTSWVHLPTIVAAIWVISLERGAISRRVLAARPLVWLGEVSYALYLVHLFLVLATYRVGAYDLLGPWGASVLLVVVSVAVAGIVHERFEKPARARLVARLGRQSSRRDHE